MYLIHNTRLEYLESILNDGELKSAAKTGNISEGDGIYEPHKQHFVFFSTTPNLFDPNVFARVTLYFTLPHRKRTMYIANLHSGNPAALSEWRSKGGISYKRKIPANVSDVERQKTLMNLYKYSVSQLKGKAFFVFQQVAIKNNFSLKNLVAISFNTPDNYIKRVHKLIEKIKTKYPNVQIKIISTK
jgi:hypothetical protein